ncbi:MAG: 50S ribosomal protein L33 [Candidatus Paceibacterota bacterium]
MAQGKFTDHIIRLACSECDKRNYHTRKNKKQVDRKIEFNKFCKWCKKHTPHKEVKR